MRFWERFLFRWKVRIWRAAGDCAVNMNEVVQQYLTSLPCPACACLSPRRLLCLVPTRPQPANVIWREALKAKMIPSGISFPVFMEALMPLVPLILSVNAPKVDGDQKDTIVAWQPWVSQGVFASCHNDNGNIDHVDRGALIAELCNVVPSYFVSSSLVQAQLRFVQFRGVGLAALEWERLVSSQFAALLEWSDDHTVVRLSSAIRHVVPADSLYSLKPHPELFHQALNALALLLPTFMVSKKEVQRVYKALFLAADGVYCAEFNTDFVARFPEYCALTDHPDLQFAVRRDDSDRLMLCPHFLHANRGVSDVFYQIISPSCNGCDTVDNANSHSNNVDCGFPVRSFFRATLPYNSTAYDSRAFCEIPKKGILGLHYELLTDRDQFTLTIATADGGVFILNGTPSSLYRLGDAGLLHSGLPLEISEALASSHVVKVVAVGPANEDKDKFGDGGVASLFRHYLHVEVQAVCSLWEWAMFVGFPIYTPLTPSVEFYRRLLARLGVKMAPCTPTALLAVVCASRLLTFYEADGYNFDVFTLTRMLTENDKDAWKRRNIELRIRRYGAKFHGVSSKLPPCEHFLRQLSCLYGPEVVYVVEKQAGLVQVTASPSIVGHGAQKVLNVEKTENTTDKQKNKDDEQEYLDALCGDTIATVDFCSKEPKAKEENERNSEQSDRENRGDGWAPETENPTQGNATQMENSEVFDATFCGGGEAIQGVATAAGTSLRRAESIKGSSSCNAKRKSDNCKEQFSDCSQFFFNLPTALSDCKKGFRSVNCGPRPLPQKFSGFSTAQQPLRVAGDSEQNAFAGPASFALTPESRHVEDADGEKEIINRLTRDIMHEARKRFF